MTPTILLDDLKKFIKENTKDILLEVRTRTGTATEKERAAKVYTMGLSQKDDTTQQIPYILLKIVTGVDDKKEGEPQESICTIRMVIVTYSQDGQRGPLQLLNLIERIRERLEKETIIGGRFVLQRPFEYLIYQDTDPPYYIGEIMTRWSIPTIEREVQTVWQ